MMLMFHSVEELLLAVRSTEEMGKMGWSVTVRNWPLNFLYVESISFVRIKSNTRLDQIDGHHHHNDDGRNFFLPLPNDSWLLMLFDLIDWLLVLLLLMLWNDDDDDDRSSFLLVLNCLPSVDFPLCYLIWLIVSPSPRFLLMSLTPDKLGYEMEVLHLFLLTVCLSVSPSFSSSSDQRNLQL